MKSEDRAAQVVGSSGRLPTVWAYDQAVEAHNAAEQRVAKLESAIDNWWDCLNLTSQLQMWNAKLKATRESAE